MDHGILNVPLAKRGNIDAQIDAYKAEQQKKANADRKEAVARNKVLKADAKVALAEIVSTAGLIDLKAEKLGVSRKDLIDQLDDWAKWRPAKLIKLRGEWIAQALQPVVHEQDEIRRNLGFGLR